MSASTSISITSNSEAWKAQLTMDFEKKPMRTVLTRRTQYGPLTVQRPFYPEGDVCHLYMLHPPGGVVGGDELHINVNVKEQASVLITTPGATKFYKNTGKLAKQIQTLKVLDEGSLEWFPQENIFFDETHSQLITQIELENNAQFMGWEINCYGRPAAKDLFKKGSIETRLKMSRDGIPLIFDRLQINNKIDLQSLIGLHGHACFGTFIATQVKQDSLEKARTAIEGISADQHIGITLIDDILIARCLGQYAEQISTSLKLIWSALRPDILSRNPCHPRIWAT